MLSSSLEVQCKRQWNSTVDERHDWWGSPSCLRRGHDGRKRDVTTAIALSRWV